MPWSTLTPQQQAFLEKYLVSSKLDKLFDKHKTKKNKEITKEFEGLEALLAEARARIAQLPPDYPEHGIFSSRLADLDSQRESGDFKIALGEGKTLLAEIERTIAAFVGAVSDLRAKVSVPLQLEGASTEQFNQVDGLRQQIVAALGAGPGLPHKAALDSARATEARFGELLDSLVKAIAEMQAALAAFRIVWDPAKPKLEQIAAFDLSAVADAPSHDKAAALVAEARALLTQGNDALQGGSVATLGTATEALKTFMAKAKATDALLAAIGGEIRSLLMDRYSLFSDWHERLVETDPGSFLDADKATLEKLIPTVQMDIQRLRAAIATQDMATQLAALADLPAIEARGRRLEAATLAAEKNLIDKNLEGKGVGDSHRAAMTKLYELDKGSFAAVEGILAQTTGVLGNAEVTKEFLDLKKGEVATTALVADGAYAVYKPAQEEMDKQQAELAALQERETQLKEQVAAAGKKVPKPLQDQLAEVQRNIGLRKAVVSSLAGPLAALKAAYDSAKQTADETRAVYEAAQKQKLVLDAVTHGALSPDHGRPLPAQARADILEVIDKNPKLGKQALDLLETTENPESFAKAAKFATGKAADGFKSDSGTYWPNSEAFCERYAGNLMKMAASLPPDQVARMEAYIGAGKQFGAVGDMRGSTWGEVTSKKTKHISDNALSGGTLDMAKAAGAVDDVLFHPDGVRDATPELGNHMLKTLDFLKGNEGAREKIEKVTKPATAGGQALIKKSSGKDPAAQGNDDAGKAVLNAMLTPVYQGKVGSCFATSSIVRMRQDNPEMALDTFIHMVKTGEYKPKSGRAVPVIQNVPADEDPLVRSLEYSAATATARLADSNERSKLQRYTAKGVDTLKDKFKDEKWPLLEAKIDAAISDAFTFIYDPEEKVSLSNDGSSDRGRYVLMRKDDMTKVNDQAAFVAAITDKVMAKIKDGDLKDGVTRADIEGLIAADAFVNAMKHTKREKGRDVEKYPWELASGGATDLAAKTILGENGRTVGYMPELAEGADLDAAARTKDVIKGFLDQFGALNGMCTMRTVGQHGFNGLPNHPSLEKLKEGGDAKYAENLQKELYDKGTELKSTVIPAERAAFMFDQEMEKLLNSAKGDALAKLEEGIAAHRPSADLTPALFEKAVKDATRGWRDECCKKKVEDWKKAQTDAGKPEPGPDEAEKKLKEYEKSYEEYADDISTNRLMKDLGAPEFTIADTNWGSGKDHVFFVIVPDPASGEPKLMQRRDPPGTLSYPGDEWLRKMWAKID